MYKNIIFVVLCVTALSGCASSYVTPNKSVDLAQVSDIDIQQAYQGKPTANFPARIVYVRLEKAEENYYGSGSYNVVKTWGFESEEDEARLSRLVGVAGIAPLSEMLIPSELSGLKDLRMIAAKMHADMLLVYSVDSASRVEKKEFGLLEVITLGFRDNKEVDVKASASATFYDVKTEYLYGLAQASSRKAGQTDIWNREKVVAGLRKAAEKEALHNLVPQIEATWEKIREDYAEDQKAAAGQASSGEMSEAK